MLFVDNVLNEPKVCHTFPTRKRISKRQQQQKNSNKFLCTKVIVESSVF